MQFLQECKVLRPPDTDKFTQTHLCTFANLCCPPTEQLAPQYFTIPSTHGCHISSQPCSYSPNCISFEVIFTLFLDLHHYRLMSLQTYVIVKSQHTLTNARRSYCGTVRSILQQSSNNEEGFAFNSNKLIVYIIYYEYAVILLKNMMLLQC